jgi:hypothetical protein
VAFLKDILTEDFILRMDPQELLILMMQQQCAVVMMESL